MAETEAEKLFLQAEILCDAKQYQRAEITIRNYIALDNLDAVKAWWLLADILCGLENEAGAFEAIDHALQLDPNNALTHIAKGNIASRFGHADLAISHFEQSVKILPIDNPAYGALAILYVNVRRYDEAANHARNGLQYNPNDSNCLNALSYVSARKGQVVEAIKFSGLALNTDPLSTHNLTNSAFRYFAFFRFYKAFKMAESALKLQPNQDESLQIARTNLLTMFIPYGMGKALLYWLMIYRKLFLLVVFGAICSIYYFLYLRPMRDGDIILPLTIIVGALLYLPITKSFAVLFFSFSRYKYLLDRSEKWHSALRVATFINALLFMVWIQSERTQFVAVLVAYAFTFGFQRWMARSKVVSNMYWFWLCACSLFSIGLCYLMLVSGFWFVVLLLILLLLMSGIAGYYNTLEND